MRRTVFAASILFAAFSSTALHADNCKLVEIDSLPMQALSSGRIFVPVRIDNTDRIVMIDTGAPLGIMSGTAMDELDIKRRPVPSGHDFYSSTGAKPKQFVTVPSVKIGPEEATYTDFLVGDFPGAWPPHFAGTIGADILTSFDLDIDFAAKKFNLFSQDHCPGKVVYWATSYTDADITMTAYNKHIEVPMSLDGHNVDAIIDTGAPITTLNETDAWRLFGLNTSSPGIETVTDADGGKAYFYRFKMLTLAGIAMPNPRIRIVPDGVARASRADLNDRKVGGYQGIQEVHAPTLILGIDALQHLHVYIAYKEKKIYATAASPSVAAADTGKPASP